MAKRSQQLVVAGVTFDVDCKVEVKDTTVKFIQPLYDGSLYRPILMVAEAPGNLEVRYWAAIGGSVVWTQKVLKVGEKVTLALWSDTDSEFEVYADGGATTAILKVA